MEDAPKMLVAVRHSRLIFGAGAIALCIASILAIAAAITCHTAGAELARGLSWEPSLLYGAILWLPAFRRGRTPQRELWRPPGKEVHRRAVPKLFKPPRRLLRLLPHRTLPVGSPHPHRPPMTRREAPSRHQPVHRSDAI